MVKYYAPAIKGGKQVLIPVLGFLEVCEVGHNPALMQELCQDETVGKFWDDDTMQYRVPFYTEFGELNALVVNMDSPHYQPYLFGILVDGFKALEVCGRYYAPKWENFAGGRQLFVGEPRY